MKIDQNFTRNPMDPSDLAYYAWFKSCASFFLTCSELGTAQPQLFVTKHLVMRLVLFSIGVFKYSLI